MPLAIVLFSLLRTSAPHPSWNRRDIFRLSVWEKKKKKKRLQIQQKSDKVTSITPVTEKDCRG